MDIPKKDQTYVLVTPERLESLVKTNFMLSKSVMLFESCAVKANIRCTFQRMLHAIFSAYRQKRLSRAGSNA